MFHFIFPLDNVLNYLRNIFLLIFSLLCAEFVNVYPNQHAMMPVCSFQFVSCAHCLALEKWLIHVQLVDFLVEILLTIRFSVYHIVYKLRQENVFRFELVKNCRFVFI